MCGLAERNADSEPRCAAPWPSRLHGNAGRRGLVSATPGDAGGDPADSYRIMRQVMIRIRRGIAGAFRSHCRVFVSFATGVFVLNLFLPPAMLSIARKPADYFAFNAWLPEFPAYLLRGDVPLQRKLEFIPNLALFWLSADSPFGGVDWGFAVTVSDLLRFFLLALIFGLYFALVFHIRDEATTAGLSTTFGRGGGASGALASVLGISTGGCTVMGCGAPVIPVVGLAFVGLSSGTLVLLAELSRVATAIVFSAVTAAVAYLAWRAGGRATVVG